MGNVRVIHYRAKTPDHGVVVNTCGGPGWDEINAFKIGPCPTPYGEARIFENAWQFTKKYADQTDQEWESWMNTGLQDGTARRFPRGRGKIPTHANWGSQKLGYIDARKMIYGPLFVHAVEHTFSIKKLEDMMDGGETIWLRDHDGYDHVKQGLSLTEVLNNPKRIMGHAFWVAALLTQDSVLNRIYHVENQPELNREGTF